MAASVSPVPPHFWSKKSLKYFQNDLQIIEKNLLRSFVQKTFD